MGRPLLTAETQFDDLRRYRPAVGICDLPSPPAKPTEESERWLAIRLAARPPQRSGGLRLLDRVPI